MTFTEFSNNVKKSFSDLWASMKRHPFITVGIIAAIVIASVVTCGVALFVPAAFALMAAVGPFLGGLGLGILAGYGISKACAPRRHHVRHDDNGIGMGILGGLATGIGAVFLIGMSPVASVVFCGVAFVAGFVHVCAMIGNAVLKSCCQPESAQPASVQPTPHNSPVSRTRGGHHNSYSRLPAGVAPTALSITQPSAATTPLPVATIPVIEPPKIPATAAATLSR